jgi:hypothetical protein
MTRQDRELAIADNLAYVGTVVVVWLVNWAFESTAARVLER